MVRIGLEMLVASGAPSLRGKNIGVICNQASVGPGFRHCVDLLGELRMVRVGALLGPEHGVRGEAQDMISVKDGGAEGTFDKKTKAPVHSLYGDSFASLTPTAEMLEGLDTLVFDMQDVGARYYTFYATMILAMQAAAEAGIEFVVLDRPNPLGGEAIEGGVQEDGYFSFVGIIALPVVHGMTVGELALWANHHLDINCELTIITMEGWERKMLWEDTALPFIPPSPNMPTPDTARVYPGMCLVEGTNLSEGRGTTRPFEQVGAPFYDRDQLADALNKQGLPGVHFRSMWFRPTFHKFGGKDCAGVFAHVTDRRTFLPYRTGLAFLMTAQDHARDKFRWRTEKYEFVDDKPAIDLLTGTAAVRRSLDDGLTLAPFFPIWKEQEEAFRAARKEFLLY